MHSYKFYLGNIYVNKKFFIYNIGNTGKEFLKFTKPFEDLSWILYERPKRQNRI